MASLLDGIAAEIHKGFTGKLHAGTLFRQTAGGVNDEYGDPITPVPTEYLFEGFVDDYDDRYRAVAGISVGDVSVNIISGSITTSPQKDDTVVFTNGPRAGVVFQLRNRRTDPAQALWTCGAFRVGVSG
jgi:hypothetical protein